jgi:hypothetical protein
MVSNLSVYPVTVIMILLGKSFIDGFSRGNPGNPPFVPPMVGDWASPERFGAIIALAIILMLPEVANMVRDALKSPDFKYAASIGKSLGVGAGVVGAPGRGVAGGLFGTNRDGTPKAGTQWLYDRFGGFIGSLGGGGNINRVGGARVPVLRLPNVLGRMRNHHHRHTIQILAQTRQMARVEPWNIE